MPGTLAFELHADAVMLLVHRREPPTDPEWDVYVAACKDVLERRPEGLRALVITEGGGPTVDQRRRLNDMLAGRGARAAIVAESIMIRGIVTAMSWWNPLIKSFRKHEVPQAFTYLDLPGADMPRVLARLDALRASIELPPIARPGGGPTFSGPTKPT